MLRLVTDRPRLLMIHGVNSTLEWSRNAKAVLAPHFDCRLLRYRLFHTLWGPLKVYFWPLAWLFVPTFFALWACLKWLPSAFWNPEVNLAAAGWGQWPLLAACAVLLCEAAIVMKAEILWAAALKRDKHEEIPGYQSVGDVEPRAVWFPVALFSLLGIAGAIWAQHPWQWVAPVAATSSVAAFLDLREYRRDRGPWKTMFMLPILASTIPGLAIYDLFGADGPSWRGWSALAIVCLIGICEPFLRGELALTRVKDCLEFASDESPEPFVVAHSLGTYLTSNSLREIPQLRLGRMVFTGCVLERDFPWREVVPPHGSGFTSLTNYAGRLDIVPNVTGLIRWFWKAGTFHRLLGLGGFRQWLADLIHWRPLGAGGARGFNGPGELVHEQPMVGACQPCAGVPEKPCIVHNVVHRFGTHSRLNRESSFHRWRWIPSLWGMCPQQYTVWFTTCRAGAAYGPTAEGLQPKNLKRYKYYEERLLRELWSWPAAPEMSRPVPRPLEEHVRELLAVMEPETQRLETADLMDEIPVILFRTIEEAWQESLSLNPDLEKVAKLHPQLALEHAVAIAIALHANANAASNGSGDEND